MLIVMTFEVGLLFATSLGLGLGTFLTMTLFKLPELPANCEPTEKSGDYSPNPDPCCSAISLASASQSEAKNLGVNKVKAVERSDTEANMQMHRDNDE